MTNTQPFIVGRAALLVIDIQASTFIDHTDNRSIPNMDGYEDTMWKACALVDAARKADVPVIFVQEAHRPDLIDFGRELDGAETVHCVEGDAGTELAVEQLKITPEQLLIDGNRFKPYREIPAHCIIKGDGKYLSIAAA